MSEVEQLFTDTKLTFYRSQLERNATCPMSARLNTPSAGDAAASGEEAHQAIGKAISSYVDSNGNMSPNDIRNEIETNLRMARPDVQPDALNARVSAWSIGQYIAGLNPINLLRWDGGTGDNSGQISYEIMDGIVISSELDFLHATDSPEVLDEIDWKTGHKKWTFEDVKNSFQFQFHAILGLTKYPEVDRIRIRVWNTRSNSRTALVPFFRRQLPDFVARVSEAVNIYLRNKHVATEQVEAWPTRDKCRICDACTVCPVADRDLSESNPQKDLEQLIVITEKAAKLKERLWSAVEATGEDVKLDSGECFGNGKPKAERKPNNPLYSVK